MNAPKKCFTTNLRRLATIATSSASSGLRRRRYIYSILNEFVIFVIMTVALKQKTDRHDWPCKFLKALSNHTSQHQLHLKHAN